MDCDYQYVLNKPVDITALPYLIISVFKYYNKIIGIYSKNFEKDPPLARTHDKYYY